MSNACIQIVNMPKDKKNTLRFALLSFLQRNKQANQVNQVNQVILNNSVMTKEVRYDYSENIKYCKEYSYDKYNNIILEVKRNRKNSVTSYIEYKYNNKQQKSMCTYYNSLGAIQYSTEYIYDNSGNLVKESRFDKYNNLVHYIIYKYDKNKEISQFTKYNANGEVISV